jgi:hypothetical protein
MQLKSRLARPPNSGAILRHFTMYKAQDREGFYYEDVAEKSFFDLSVSSPLSASCR